MTREEEIIQESIKKHPRFAERRVGFIDGAEWADKHPNISEEEQVGMAELGMIWQKKALIDKACEWLSKHISPEDIYDGETNEVPNTYLTVNLYDNMLDFMNNFRKAMEE